MKNKFEKGASTYVCDECGKRTRDTGYGEFGTGLCKKCYRIFELENSLNDGEITEEEYETLLGEIE